MKENVLVFVVILISQLSASACAQQASVDEGVSAVEKASLSVVASRIDAYNDHGVDAYLAAHAEDLKIYEYRDKSIGNTIKNGLIVAIRLIESD